MTLTWKLRSGVRYGPKRVVERYYIRTMPAIDFEALPDDARLWVFGAEHELTPAAVDALLREVDAFLMNWSAHGAPLWCAREWRDGRFLAIGVDQSSAGASGCSIDGMFRVLQLLRPSIGANLLPGNRVYWRDHSGRVQSAQRSEFLRLAEFGEITGNTLVFDTAITTAADWRARFERPARETWHGRLIEKAEGGVEARKADTAVEADRQ